MYRCIFYLSLCLLYIPTNCGESNTEKTYALAQFFGNNTFKARYEPEQYEPIYLQLLRENYNPNAIMIVLQLIKQSNLLIELVLKITSYIPKSRHYFKKVINSHTKKTYNTINSLKKFSIGSNIGSTKYTNKNKKNIYIYTKNNQWLNQLFVLDKTTNSIAAIFFEGDPIIRTIATDTLLYVERIDDIYLIPTLHGKAQVVLHNDSFYYPRHHRIEIFSQETITQYITNIRKSIIANINTTISPHQAITTIKLNMFSSYKGPHTYKQSLDHVNSENTIFVKDHENQQLIAFTTDRI